MTGGAYNATPYLVMLLVAALVILSIWVPVRYRRERRRRTMYAIAWADPKLAPEARAKLEKAERSRRLRRAGFNATGMAFGAYMGHRAYKSFKGSTRTPGSK